jgi:ABC-type multidrug transport system, ATPase component
MKIEVNNVTKKFKESIVVNDVTVTFESGKIYGLIGKNGSGKSVLLKMICGFYSPTEGEILFDGENIIKQQKFPPNTGALIERPGFIGTLTGLENLILLSRIQNKITVDDIHNTLKQVNLYEEKDKLFSKYSLGMKQKLGIAQAIMENPDIIILDEPFNGIEDETTEELRSLLLELKKQNKLIILATHIKDDIDKIVDVVYRLNVGKLELKERNK